MEKRKREKRTDVTYMNVWMNILLKCNKLYKLDGSKKETATDTAKRHTHMQSQILQTAFKLCLGVSYVGARFIDRQ